MTISRTILAAIGSATLLTATAFAQSGSFKANLEAYGATHSRTASSPYTGSTSSTPDVYRVNYFRNANTGGPDSTIDIVDPGTNGAGNICADIYVITPDEELAECCGCVLTPDQLSEFSVNRNLTGNAATGGTVHNGAIKIISSAPTSSGGCDAGHPTPTPELREWITHGQNGEEVEFSFADLSTAEESALASTCAFYEAHLSGHGVCSCPAVLPN